MQIFSEMFNQASNVSLQQLKKMLKPTNFNKQTRNFQQLKQGMGIIYFTQMI